MRQRSPSAVNKLIQRLPLSAEDIYYRDIIGNISSSHVSKVGPARGGVDPRDPRADPADLRVDQRLKLEILPRYVLFGGWKIAFYLGYNLPLKNYLSSNISNSASLLLNVSFFPNFQESISVDNHIVRVIFPEGSSDIEVFLPFQVDKLTYDKHYTYLDTQGRPVVILEKKKCCPCT